MGKMNRGKIGVASDDSLIYLRAAQAQYGDRSGVSEQDIQEATLASEARWDKERRANAAKLILSEMARNLADEEVLNDPEKLTQFESQVFEDITNDYYANKLSQDMQMPNLLRVSVDGMRLSLGLGTRRESAFRLLGLEILRLSSCLLRQLTTLELCITSDFLRQ